MTASLDTGGGPSIRWDLHETELLSLPGPRAFFIPACLARHGVAIQSLALLWAVHGATGSLVLTGLCIAPIVIPAATALQQATPRSLYVQAVTWTGSASALGSAASAPLVGHLVDRTSAQSGYLALAGLDLLLLVATACIPMIDGGRRARPAPEIAVTPSP